MRMRLYCDWPIPELKAELESATGKEADLWDKRQEAEHKFQTLHKDWENMNEIKQTIELELEIRQAEEGRAK